MDTTWKSREPSPWPGSQHEELLLWEFDGVRSLAEVASRFEALSDELLAARAAGWSMVRPIVDGHLSASRPSRRQRAQVDPNVELAPPVSVPPLSWRLRLIDEPALQGRPSLDFSIADRTPTLTVGADGLEQLAGPRINPSVLTELNRQVTPGELRHRRWALAPARVGPSFDLVGEGSLLRGHAISDGVLLRTVETLGFRRAADRATSLAQAAAAYQRFAAAATAMTRAGGELSAVDDGFLVVEYP